MARGERKGARGFTLIEVIIVLAIISVILGMLAPFAFQLFSSERASALEQELQQIYSAVVGDPAKGIYGYVGDVGNYPASLLDLVRQPLDANNQPLPGWKGPYVQNARIENGVWLDPFARPYEYYLVSGSEGAPDKVAIISRGPDGLSTGSTTSSWIPNDSSTYAGTEPVADNYASQSNADNILFPRVEGNVKALNAKTDGEVAFNILNWDNNKEVNTFVPACPELYTITATSVARKGKVEANIRYVQGLSFNLAQGQYQVTIAPQGLATTSWAETITVMPGSTLTRTLNLTGLDSSGTPQFNLTVTNGFTTTELEVFQFDSKLSGYLPGSSTNAKSYVNEGETRVFAIKGCSQVYVRKKSKSDIVDQFVMPYGHSSRELGTEAAALVVRNLYGHDHHDHGNGDWHHHDHHHHHHHHGYFRIFVYRNGILIGAVAHHHTREFKDLLKGNKITIVDRDGITLYENLSIPMGTTSIIVGS